jgi:uncharacterized membrane protein YccF (DUF307 family)
MKKFFNTFFNVLWAICFGLWYSIVCIVLGAAFCVTLVGIPVGVRYFKLIKLVFAPAGKDVRINSESHRFGNTVWLIFGGFIFWLLYAILAVVFHITIIGIPIGRQFGKLRRYYWAPYNAEVIDMPTDIE